MEVTHSVYPRKAHTDMFIIPTDLSLFSVSGLESLRTQAVTEYNTLLASVTHDNVTDEQLERLEALKAFNVSATAQLAAMTKPADDAGQKDRADKLATFDTAVLDTPVVDKVADPVDVKVEEPVVTPSLSDIADKSDKIDVAVIEDEQPKFGALVAAADTLFPSGQELTLRQVAEAFVSRTAGYRGMGKNVSTQHSVAMINRDYPAQFTVTGDDSDMDILLAVANEKRLPGGSLIQSAALKRKEIEAAGGNQGSLTAAAGWCA
ncbi:MAG: hypothetical protein EHM35_15050, partial [Planctomycetaceae bacterium]